MNDKTIFILSIDGGGVRGIIPALILKDIKERLEKRNINEPFYKIFDLIAGTSTGGLIALGLASPTLAKNSKDQVLIDSIIDFYTVDANHIFKKLGPSFLTVLKQAFGPKYSNHNFRKILYEIFENDTLKSALTNILLTTYDMHEMETYFFKKSPINDYDRENFYMRDIALATAAAPTLFPAVSLSPISHPNKKYCFVDGGVFANNPSLCAFIEAKKIFPDAGRYVILSLGTGHITQTHECNKIKNAGLLSWISPTNGVPILSALMEGQSDSTVHMLSKLPNVDLYRLNVELDKSDDALDNASEENINRLIETASELLETHHKDIEEFCNLLETLHNIE